MKIIYGIIRHFAWFISYNSIQLSRLLVRLDPEIKFMGKLIQPLLMLSISLSERYDLDHWVLGDEPDSMVCKYEI